MNEVDIKETRKLKLTELYCNSDSGTRVCSSGNLIYKFYGELSYIRELILKERLNILSNVNVPVLVKPIDMIVEKRLFSRELKGISMEKVSDAISLYDLSKDKTRVFEYLLALINASIGLSNIHEVPENIVLSDGNFTNVLLQKNSNGMYINPRFIDIDSAKVMGLSTPQISYLGAIYYKVGGKNYIASKNNDRLVYMLYFLKSIFNDIVYNVSDDEYDKMSEKISGLKDIRKVFLDLKKCKAAYVPYIYEFKEASDAFTLSKKM